MSQADQNIANDTGSNVRSDINTNLAALFSNNSGSSAPSTTTAFMWWADTSNDALKIRNAADDGFVTVGTLSSTNLGLATKASPTFTGNVGLPAGTAGAPAIRRSDDTDTGIYFSAGNTVDISTGGTRRAHVDTNGITIRDRKAIRLRDTSNSNFVAIRAPDNVASDVTLTLPGDDGNADEYLKTDGSGNLSFAALPTAATVPTGSVHVMATTTVPTGYLECDGSAISRTTYSDLFSTIGTTWGAGDGSSTFNVPDLRGEFIRGWDNSRGVDGSRNFASSQSDDNKSHNHTITDPGHNHTTNTDLEDPNDSGITQGPGGRSHGILSSGSTILNSATTGISLATSGGSEARPRNIAMMYVIKT